MIYTIGEIAKKLDIAPSALRYYDKEGLFPFVERSEGGIRMFKDSDFAWLEIIECLKKTGMPIKDIKHFIDCCVEGDDTIDERLTIINQQREVVQLQIKEMQKMLEVLDFKSWYYETAKSFGTCEFGDKISMDDVPDKHKKFAEQYQK